ncbi:MAG: endonuclease IV [Ruminococcaceae bacterium]|nr:endonuclease IV [Oscillospiraceae bacterium]
MIKFGPSGNGDAFYAAGYKSSVQMPLYLSQIGLDAYEYQCSKGVKITQPTAQKLGEAAREHGIALSIHAPYYINLATDDEEKRVRGVKYITDTLQAADWMGATRIVVHSGACAKMERRTAMQYAEKTLRLALDEAKNLGLSHVHICPETMGKINQLGDLDEVIELCRIDDSFLPTIDFGHLNARTHGGLSTFEAFEAVFDKIENGLGRDRLNGFHSHFSRIEFTAGGEKMHHTFADIQYGPEFEPVIELCYRKGLSPTIICESAGTMSEDALTMKQYYLSLQEGNRHE